MTQPINPNDLLAEAQEVINNGGFFLEDYSETMWSLRNAGWSFRKIAEWMTNKDIECTHNQVYYVLSKDTTLQQDAEELDVDFRDEEIEANTH
tara:strand:+ start:140 stop:418 length:279 start_codon:yes stop_codon:yes gene_type:complete